MQKGSENMNRIFKVIWSKTRNCYVVASELAKGRTKAASTGDKAKRLALAAITALMLLPVGGYSYAADTATVTDTSATQQTVYTKDGADNTFVKKGSDNGNSLTIGASESKTYSTHQFVTGAQTTYDGLSGQVVTQATGDQSSISLKVGNSGDLTYNFPNYSEVTTTKDGGTTFTSHYQDTAQTIDNSTTIKGNTVTTGSVTASNGVVDKTTQDGAIVKTDKTIGENVTNLDAALAKETAARIGADKAQDKVIQAVNDNLVQSVTTINKNVADGFTALNQADANKVAAREAKDNELNERITNEANAIHDEIKAGDTALDNRITAVKESLQQEAADTYVSKDDASVQDGAVVKANNKVGQNVQALDTALAKETAARIGADKAQDQVIAQVNQNMVDGFNTINKNMADGFTALNQADANEAAAREAADTTLQTNIDNEAAERKAADTVLDDKITAETSARVAADTKLVEAVNSGLSLSNDNVLQKNTTTIDAQGNVTTSKTDANEMILNKGKDNQITLNEKGIKVGTNSSMMDKDGVYTGGDTYAAAKAAMSADGKIKGANGAFTIDENGNVASKATITGETVTDGKGASMSNGTVTGKTLTDGIATITNGNINTSGSVTGGTVTSTGNISAVGDIHAGGAITGASASIQGALTAGSATITGDLTAGGAIQGKSLSDGTATMQNGNLTGVKNLSAETITTSGDATIGGDLTVNGKLNVDEIDLTKNGIIGDNNVTASTKVAAGEITSYKKATSTKDGSEKESAIDYDENGTSTWTKSTDADGNWKKSTLTVEGNDVTSKVIDSEKNSNLSTQTSTQSQSTLKDKDSNTNTATQSATESSSVLQDKEGKTSTFQQRVDEILNQINSSDTVFSKVDQKVDNITSEVTDGTNTTSSAQTTTDITNTANNGTISNTAKNIENTASENITNTAKNGSITNDAKNIANIASETLSNSAKNITNTTTDNMTNTIGKNLTTTVGGDMSTEVTGNQSNTVKGTLTETVTGKVTEDYKSDLSTKVGGDETHAVTGNQTTTVSGNRTVNVKGTETENFNTLETNVKTDQKTSVGGNQTTIVTGNQTNNVSGSKNETVKGSVTEKYGSQATTVDGDQSTNIGGNQTTVVAKDQTNTVSGNKTETVKGAVNETYGSQTTKVNGDQSTTVTGKQTNSITGDQVNTIGGNQTTTVTGNVTEDYKVDLSTKVGGNETHAVTGNQTVTVSKDRTVNVKGTETENFNAQVTNVKTDQRTSVGGNQTNIVAGNQQNTVSGSKTETVKGSVTEKYGSQATTVDGDQSTHVGGNQSNVVTGNQTNTISGSKTETVKGAVSETYGSQTTKVNGDQSATVTGKQTNSITGDQVNTIGGSQTTTVTGDVTEDYKANLSTTVGGNQTTTVTGDSSLTAENITNEAKNKITNKAIDVETDATSSIVQKVANDYGSNTSTQLSYETKEEMSQADGKTASYLRGAAEEKSQLTDGSKKTTIDTIAGQTNTNITDGTKINNTNNTVDKSEQQIKASATQYSASSKTATKMEDALVSGSNIIDVIKGLDAAGNPTISSAVTDGTTITGISQNAKDISLSAAGGTITNDAQNITNMTTEDMTNTIGKNLKTTVGGDMSTEVKGNQSNTVEGTLTETVTGKATENYNGGLETTITGEEKHTVNGDQTNTITGKQATTVTGDSSLSAKNITNTASEKITSQIGNDGKVKSEMTADGITNTAEGGTIYNKSKDILNEASGDILNFADGEIGNVATKITNITGDNTVTSDTNGTTFENKAHNTAIKEGTVTKTTISGNTIKTGQATMDYAEVMKDLGVHGNATVDQKLTVKGDSDLQGNANVGKNLTVNGTSDLKGNVTMESNATVQKDLTVNGTTTTNKLVVNNGTTIKGGTTTDTLHVTSTSTFDGKATFKDIVTMEKDLSVAGSMTASSYKVGDKTYIDSNGINANDQKVVNVAPGRIAADSKDAINGSQLYQTNERVTSVENRVGTVENRVDKLDSRVDKVGANAAALANLHPLEFDADSKWNIAAAVGGYKGEKATAIGAFYRPNENVMVNVSSSFGTGENMYGGGISLRIGQGGNKARRNATNGLTEREKAMQKQIDSLTSRLDALLSVINPNMSKDFPDVPENHWAYEAVSRLAGNGVIQGYEDGKYHGDRTMTRYEMAEIIYNALSKGAKAEKKLVEEFKPELQAMAAQKKV